MQSKAATVAQYLKDLPEDRHAVISAVRKVILDNLPAGFEECMNYGMIGYVVPHSIYPAGYHCNPKDPLPFACLASQKNHMALYLMTVYDPLGNWFQTEWEKTGKKLDMGKSCIRFKKLEDLPLDLISRTIAKVSVRDYIAYCESMTRDRKPTPRSEIQMRSRAKSSAKKTKAAKAKPKASSRVRRNKP
jgi:hypothetical protein